VANRHALIALTIGRLGLKEAEPETRGAEFLIETVNESDLLFRRTL